MIKPLLPIVLAAIFLLLSLLHMSWALGNTWGLQSAIPQNGAGQNVLNPSSIDCVIVGLGLFALATFYILKSGLTSYSMHKWLNYSGSVIIAVLFFLRAVGDFKYVGFFKKVTTSNFAHLDTYYYSPLCLFLAIAAVVILLQD